jgi:tetratricopeptide (TPR) repeat protein
MHRLRLAVLLTALGGTHKFIGAQASTAQSADSISAAIDRAYLSGDSARIHGARAEVERLATSFPNNGLLRHYLGFALYREATASARGGAKAASLLTRAKEALEESLKTYPLAETHALLASIDGQLIAGDPSRAMELGMASQVSMSAATRLGATNPRVWLLKGESAVFTPAEYGGGPTPTREHLMHAIELFGNDVPKPGEPRWGRAEVHIWLGQVYERLNDRSLAVAEYRKALEIAPDFNWAKALAAALK